MIIEQVKKLGNENTMYYVVKYFYSITLFRLKSNNYIIRINNKNNDKETSTYKIVD